MVWVARDTSTMIADNVPGLELARSGCKKSKETVQNNGDKSDVITLCAKKKKKNILVTITSVKYVPLVFQEGMSKTFLP